MSERSGDPVSGASPNVCLVLGPSAGGVGQHVRSLAGWLRQFGHTVTVVGPAAAQDVSRFTDSGAEFIPVELTAGLNPLRNASLIKKLRRALADADIVHAHNLTAGFQSAIALRPARRSSTPSRPAFVVTWHNLLAHHGLKRTVLQRLERRIARSADTTLAASEDLVTRLNELGARDVRMAPVAAPALSAPTRDRDELRRELGIGAEEDRPLVLSVGRLNPQKSFDVLIAAAALWSRRDTPPLVVIVGGGPQRVKLAALAERLRAPVVFLGHRTDVSDLLNACDIAVVTSRWEARQLFAQEALRAGKPLVATAVGGIPGLVANGALLVQPGDVAALDAAVSSLVDDPKLAADIAAKGRRQAATWPSEEETAAQVAEVYAELLRREP